MIDLLEIVRLFRIGMNAYAIISLDWFAENPVDGIDDAMGRIYAGIHRGDFLHVADVLQYEVIPRYEGWAAS